MDPSLFDKLSSSTDLFKADQDWHVVVTDIQGSTEAVLNGKYKEVNLIGAACIAAIRNAFQSKELAYVFGGDGATFLIPTSELFKALELLKHVQKISRLDFNLNLRIGQMNVSEVNELGGEIYYGFIELNSNESFSYFRGNGIQIAEKEIKKRSAHSGQDITNENSTANLDGISCRLTAIKSQRGKMMSLIVRPHFFGKDQDLILEQLISLLKQGNGLLDKRPISESNAKRKVSIKTSILEAHLRKRKNNLFSFIKAFLFLMMESLISYVLFALNIPLKKFGSPKKYTEALIHQSDWIKMDGDLKLVIDLNQSEKDELLSLLNELEKNKKITFGYYESDSAVMVCHYQSGVDNRHMHFVDGSEGGLTRAAIHLKSKLNE